MAEADEFAVDASVAPVGFQKWVMGADLQL
jgi:hypothetical protein